MTEGDHKVRYKDTSKIHKPIVIKKSNSLSNAAPILEPRNIADFLPKVTAPSNPSIDPGLSEADSIELLKKQVFDRLSKIIGESNTVDILTAVSRTPIEGEEIWDNIDSMVAEATSADQYFNIRIDFNRLRELYLFPSLKSKVEPTSQKDILDKENPIVHGLSYIWNTVIGDWNNQQDPLQILANVGVGLIPVVDQVLDFRDFTAHLYYMVFQKDYKDPMRWLGLGLTAIGAIPLAGSIAKGLGKLALSSDVGKAIKLYAEPLLIQIRQINPEWEDISKLKAVINENWGAGVTASKEVWMYMLSSAKDKINGLLLPPGFVWGADKLASAKQELLSTITEIENLSKSMLDEALEAIKSEIEFILDELNRVSQELLDKRKLEKPPTSKTIEPEFTPVKSSENNIEAKDLFNHPERNRQLETVLTGNEKVPVIIDNSLTTNTVEVHYLKGEDGLVDANSIYIKAGPSASSSEIMLHGRTVTQMKRYAGLLGKVIQLKNRILKLFEIQTPEIGSSAWEAMLEVKKLERIIDFRMQLRSKGIGTLSIEDFNAEIVNLEAQLARYKKIFEEMDLSEGVGYIAARGLPDLNKRLDSIDVFKDRFKKLSQPSTPELTVWREKQKQKIFQVEELATKVKSQRDKLSHTTGDSRKKVKQELERLVKEFTEEANAVEIELSELEKLSKMYSQPYKKLAENELESLEDIHNVRNRLRETELESEVSEKGLLEPNQLSEEWQKISKELDVEALRDYKPEPDELAEYERIIAKPKEKAAAEFSQIQENVGDIYKELGEELLEGKRKEYDLLNSQAGEIQGIRNKLQKQKENDLKNLSDFYLKIPIRNQILTRNQIELKNNYSLKELQNKINENWAKKDQELLEKLEAIERQRKLIEEDIKDTIELGELSSWNPHNYGNPSIEPCFPPGTLVKTPKGYKKIEDFVIGDLVLAYDFNINDVVAQPILELYKSQTEYLVDISIDGEIITATRQHRFWVESSGEWLSASELESGMKVRLANENLTTIDLAKTYAYQSETYNLEVAEVHNYFVGTLGTLVHNGKGDIDKSKFADNTKKDGKIYHIIDSSSGKPTIIYVGKTTQETVEERFKQHLNKKPSWKKKQKLRLLRIEPIEQGKWTDYETAVWEQHYIDDAIAKGYPIENDLTTPPISKEKYDLYKDLHDPCI